MGRLIRWKLGYDKFISMIQFVRANGFKALYTKLRQESEFKSGKCVGKDANGIHYFEDTGLQLFKDRWAEWPKHYYNLKTRDSMEATEIPPEWHLWITRGTDKVPSENNFSEPIFREPHRPNPTGSLDAYLPQGHFMNPDSNTDEVKKLINKSVESWFEILLLCL